MDKGIRQNSTKEWTHSLTAVPFVRGHRSVFPRTLRNTGVYTRHPTFVTATSGVLTRLPEKLSKNGMRVYTLPNMQSEKKLRVYTASEAKGLIVRPFKTFQVCWTEGFWKVRKLSDKRDLWKVLKGETTLWTNTPLSQGYTTAQFFYLSNPFKGSCNKPQGKLTGYRF